MEVSLEYTFLLQRQGTHNTQQEYTVPIPASTLWLTHGVLSLTANDPKRPRAEEHQCNYYCTLTTVWITLIKKGHSFFF